MKTTKMEVAFGVVLLLFLSSTLVVSQGSDPEFVYPDVFNDPERDAFLYGTFPEGFAWSTATSAYQIEGGWNADGKGPSIWDTYTHEGGNVYNNDTGDVACDSYNKYREDVALMKAVGLGYYRFSLSWPRILPEGTIDNVNEAGIAYYNSLIDELLAAGITPMVTLYHWDLPQALQDVGGWTNESIVGLFGDYADLCYERFGDRVPIWITLNEPWVVTILGHGNAYMAPGIHGDGTIIYVVAHNLIKSHARAWHIYDDTYRQTQNGQVGITLSSFNYEPSNPNNPSDVEAAERGQEFELGWFANPVFGDGDYPEIMKTNIGSRSVVQGFNESRLPAFTDQEKLYNKGTADFLGMNHYTTRYAVDEQNDDYTNPPSYLKDRDIHDFVDDDWETAGSQWLKIVPYGLRNLLGWFYSKYQAPIYVTENGVSTADVYDLDDVIRQKYYRSYINEVMKAVILDGVDVRGYTAWSLLDNFEWSSGYSERFGMHYVNFTDPARPRIPKASAAVYAKIIADNGFVAATTEPPTVTASAPSFSASLTVMIGLTTACLLLLTHVL